MTKRWDHHEDVIRTLYKNKSLREVQKIMMEKHGFKASTRAYRGRLDRWGIHKYNSKKRRGSATSQDDSEEASSPISVHATMHNVSRAPPTQYTAGHVIKQEVENSQSAMYGYRWSAEAKAIEHDDRASRQADDVSTHHSHWDGCGWQSDASTPGNGCMTFAHPAVYSPVYVGVSMTGTSTHNVHTCSAELAQSDLWPHRPQAGYYVDPARDHCHRLSV